MDSLGPPKILAGGVALQILLGSCWVLTILGASFKGPAGASKIHQERAPDFLFKSPMPLETFGNDRSQETPRGHEGEGFIQ